MKYKILITGRNDSAIDDFFMQMTDNFEVATTSTRFADISNHIAFFRPDVFVYCLYNESRDDMVQIANLKFRLSHSKIPLVVIGLKEDCDEFERIGVNPSNLVLHRPMSVAVIQDKIIALVKDRRFMHAVDAISEENALKKNADTAKPSDAAKPSNAASSAAQQPGATRYFAGRPVVVQPDAVQLDDAQLAAPQKRKHILVVDDNAMMLKMLKEHLHDEYDVATAASGRVALKFLERKTTDLILLDYEMPEESGPVILEQLRASEATRNIPVIFLTGVTDTKKIKEALSLKPQNYLLKPVDREKLLDTISKTIG